MNDVLFDPLSVIQQEVPVATVKRQRYKFEPDEIEITAIINCDCEQCLVGAEKDVEVLDGWSIYDTKKGNYHPIAFCEDAADAQKIVNALNATAG
jgi:hypothetical protein